MCNPGIKDYELAEQYANSFLSILHPGVALSKNTVSTFQKNAGKSYSMIVQFMRNRAARIGASDHVLVDGTLKTNTSTVNSLSDFSRKARVRGGCDISVLQAFNLEKMEPVCSKCFPGNMLDITAYEAFIQENGVTDGILVGDKGFPSSAIEGTLSRNIRLHFLNPIKRNARFIETHGMLKFEGKLTGGCCKTPGGTGSSPSAVALERDPPILRREVLQLPHGLRGCRLQEGEMPGRQKVGRSNLSCATTSRPARSTTRACTMTTR